MRKAGAQASSSKVDVVAGAQVIDLEQQVSREALYMGRHSC
jgi:hypothetical protein